MSFEHQEPAARKQSRDVHVAWQSDRKNWQVAPVNHENLARNFRLKAHALAFARAVASSRHAELIERDPSGRVIRHGKDSLSYPTRLD